MQTINNPINIHNIVMCANMIVKKDDKFLVLKRSLKKHLDPGKLHFSGGKVDPNEEPLCAAKRELFEETGLEVDNIRLEAVITELSPYHQGENWLVFYFSGNYKSGKLKKSPEGEFFWLNKKEIIDQRQNLIPAVRVIVDYILDINQGTVFASFVHDGLEKVTTKDFQICSSG